MLRFSFNGRSLSIYLAILLYHELVKKNFLKTIDTAKNPCYISKGLEKTSPHRLVA